MERQRRIVGQRGSLVCRLFEILWGRKRTRVYEKTFGPETCLSRQRNGYQSTSSCWGVSLRSHLFPPSGKPEKERRASGLGSHHAAHRNRSQADLAEQQGAVSERGKAIYRSCSVEGRPRADAEFQPPSRSRRRDFGTQGRRAIVPRRPALGR